MSHPDLTVHHAIANHLNDEDYMVSYEDIDLDDESVASECFTLTDLGAEHIVFGTDDQGEFVVDTETDTVYRTSLV